MTHMPDHELDAFTAERLLDGGRDAGFGQVGAVLDALRCPPRPHELVAGAAVVSEMSTLVAASTVVAPVRPRAGRLGRRTAGLALAGVVAVGGVAAAATGTLESVVGGGPDPVLVEVLLDPTEGVPAIVACEDATSHGEYVSSVAKSTPPGPGHGEAVSEAAKSDCGKEADEPVVDEPVVDEPVVDEPIACEDATSHGEYVSSVAKSTPPGPGHGEAVSEAAKSDCGKKTDEDKKTDEEKHAAAADDDDDDDDDDEKGNDKPGNDKKDDDEDDELEELVEATTTTTTPPASTTTVPAKGNGNGNAGGNGNGNGNGK